jgi:hypothetical protein
MILLGHFTFQGYRLICQKAMKKTGDYSYAWVFITLCWNLMARCASIAELNLKHLSWEQDSLVVIVPKHKGDQEGNKSYPKHVYANPDDPAICPILALAVTIFCMSLRAEEDPTRLFHNTGLKSGFNKALTTIMSEVNADANFVVFEDNEYGAHSIRKTSTTYCQSFPGCPSWISLFLRAGWSIGLQDRYLDPTEGNDQYCGRVACGLDFNTAKIATLCPHFVEPLPPGLISNLLPHVTWMPDSFQVRTVGLTMVY